MGYFCPLKIKPQSHEIKKESMFTVFTQNMMPPGVELVNFNDMFLCQTGSVISLVTVFEH